MTLTPNEILAALYNNCDPVQAADERFYVDCTAVRGGSVFAAKLCNELSQTNGRIHSLFTGHIGCGKSSELQHLADKMGQKTPAEGQKRFFPVIVNMSEYLDEYDVTTTDILLAVVAELAAALSEREQIQLKDSYMTKRINELKQFLLSDVEMNEGDITLGFVKTKLQRLRTSPTAREEVRKHLLPQTTNLIEEINRFFIEARTKLKGNKVGDGGTGYSDFVLILDNMEKIQRLFGNEQGEASQRALFIEGAPQLIALHAHVVYTVPLSLVRSDGSRLASLYGKAPFPLPMIKTEQRGPDHAPYEAGKAKLTELLSRRVPDGVALAEIFADDALDFLLKYSGGHVRNLMMFAREATLYAAGALPITLQAVRNAFGPTVNNLVGTLHTGDWKLLAELEDSEEQDWDNNDPDQRRLLEQLCVMEYLNGGDESGFDEDAPWYAVNPIIRELRQFKKALDTHRNPVEE